MDDSLAGAQHAQHDHSFSAACSDPVQVRTKLCRSEGGANALVQPTVRRRDGFVIRDVRPNLASKTKKGWTSAAAPAFAEDEQQMRIKELEDELELAKEKFEQEEKSCQEANARERDLRFEITQLQEQIKLSQGTVPLDARTQKLVNEKRKLALEVQSLKEGKESAEQRAKALSSMLERLQKSGEKEEPPKDARGRTRTSSRDRAADKDKAGKEEQLLTSNLQAEVKRLEKEVAAAATAAERAKSSSSARVRELEQQVEELTSSLKTKEAEKQAVEEKHAGERKALLSQVAEVQRQLEGSTKSTKQEDELRRSLRERETLMEDLQSQISQLQEENKKVCDELRELQQECSDSATRLGETKKEEDSAVGSKRRRAKCGGRFSIEESDALIEKLAGLQAQYLQMTANKTGGGSDKRSSTEVVEMQQKLERAQQERDDLTELTQQQERLIAGLEDQLHQSERRRAQLHNQIQELRGNIRVFCRIRPFLQEETSMDAPSEMTLGRSGDRPSILISLPPPQGGRKKDSQSLSFEYDEVFDPQSSQASVFQCDGWLSCVHLRLRTGFLPFFPSCLTCGADWIRQDSHYGGKDQSGQGGRAEVKRGGVEEPRLDCSQGCDPPLYGAAD
eukprot:768637-Hanusia_phi.AAC.3